MWPRQQRRQSDDKPGYKRWFATSEKAPVTVASAQIEQVACGAMPVNELAGMQFESAANALSSRSVRGDIVAKGWEAVASVFPTVPLPEAAAWARECCAAP